MPKSDYDSKRVTRSNKSVRYTIEISNGGFVKLFCWDDGDTPFIKHGWMAAERATINFASCGAKLRVWKPAKDGRVMSVKWPSAGKRNAV